MRAFILCAGKGTRLGEMTRSFPKPMITIKGKPLLYWHIELLKKHGIKEIYINLHHASSFITDYFGDGLKFDVNITYFFEKELLGTSGALSAFNKKNKEAFLLLYGDVLAAINLKKLIRFHNKTMADVTAVVHRSKHPEDSDLVEISKNSQLKKILFKPHERIPHHPYNLAAMYVINPAVLEYIPKSFPSDVAKDYLPILLKNKLSVFCYNTEEFAMDIGTPQRLKKAEEIFTL